jgi:2-phosphoglycerate kinase
MAVILISGVPGSGKTTVSLELARIFGIEQIIQTDTIKEIFQVNGYEPISYTSTHSAWRHFGEKNVNNIIKGYCAHSACFEQLLLRLISLTQEKGKHIIVEGAQITPRLFSQIQTQKIGFYLYVNDPTEHLSRFAQKNGRRTKTNINWGENYDAIRTIDLYLRQMCEKSGIIMLHNTSLDETLNAIGDEMVKLGIGGIRKCIAHVIM